MPCHKHIELITPPQQGEIIIGSKLWIYHAKKETPNCDIIHVARING